MVYHVMSTKVPFWKDHCTLHTFIATQSRNYSLWPWHKDEIYIKLMKYVSYGKIASHFAFNLALYQMYNYMVMGRKTEYLQQLAFVVTILNYYEWFEQTEN